MPWESTPRRLAEIRQRAAIAALCGGTPAAVRMSSENRVREEEEMRGINDQGSVGPRLRAGSPTGNGPSAAVPVETMPELPACDTRNSGRRERAPGEEI